MNQLKHNPKLAVATSRERAFNSRSIISMHLYCFEKSEVIYEYALKFLVRKDFPYLSELNWFIGQASASGLIEKWRIDSSARFQYTYNEINNQLTLQDGFGINIILLSCLLCATICLFIERFIHKKLKTLNPSRFWQFAEMIIDPDRHFLLETKMN